MIGPAYLLLTSLQEILASFAHDNNSLGWHCSPEHHHHHLLLLLLMLPLSCLRGSSVAMTMTPASTKSPSSSAHTGGSDQLQP